MARAGAVEFGIRGEYTVFTVWVAGNALTEGFILLCHRDYNQTCFIGESLEDTDHLVSLKNISQKHFFEEEKVHLTNFAK